ncbi:antibiotic biosynthesis monooxygenase [Pseudomonas sp. 14P_8.1_Bac3]|uniref:antibiotic biosynthesis monooxygenase n=1 Tax=Pseudomonas sp. 14P_8.1_Bac3 TaxID=2971621 RepID=UPI0021C9F73D|nr:antibiotic biosynthesis monooxygenase [Pseudomonas sp. 14P_8.1_Bac3]MCU1760190.1 antibiotic biosynthesis monooxygenase [Pseudomonas sp. 14P_8.1_Bac3]
MLISAINTVEIDAAPGRVGEVCSKLPRIVRALLGSTECVGYAITDNRGANNSWIVSGYWASESQMRAHFDHPELAGFMDMLSAGMARRINFNSFIIDPAEDQSSNGMPS